jgi:hypothetical protein
MVPALLTLCLVAIGCYAFSLDHDITKVGKLVYSLPTPGNGVVVVSGVAFWVNPSAITCTVIRSDMKHGISTKIVDVDAESGQERPIPGVSAQVNWGKKHPSSNPRAGHLPHFYFAYPSPDGQRLLGTLWNGDVVNLISDDGGRNIARLPGLGPYMWLWLADGKHCVNFAPARLAASVVRIIDLDRPNEPPPLHTNLNDISVDCSPIGYTSDGRSYFVSQKTLSNSPNEVDALELSGTPLAAHHIKLVRPKNGTISGLMISPKGSQVVWFLEPHANSKPTLPERVWMWFGWKKPHQLRELWVCDFDGKNGRRIGYARQRTAISHGLPEMGWRTIAWSPDGKQIAIGVSGDLWVVPVN